MFYYFCDKIYANIYSVKKYLVTGGAGFIGANFVKYLLELWGEEVDITILDALTYAGNPLTLRHELQRPNVRLVKGDISDTALVEELIAVHDPDYIVNFAAETHVDRSIENPRVFLETNIIGTHNMLECARKAWHIGKDTAGRPTYREGKKFLQISTDEVYGSLPKDFNGPRQPQLTDEVARVVEGREQLQCFGHGFFTEQTPLAPRSPYSASKTSADLITMVYHHTYGMPVNITRCSNNYGPYQFPEKLIPLIIKNILEGRKLPVYGRGENVRDWLYVTDHAKAIDMVLRQGRDGEIYNIGGFNEEQNISIVKTIIDIIRNIMTAEPQYRQLLAEGVSLPDYEMIEYVADRPGHDMRYAIDPAKIATELGWYPETPFAKGIEKTVRWYLDNRDWTDSVASGEYQQYYQRMYGNRL